MQVRPDAPADGGEGFKRTWSEAKEEVFLQNISVGANKAYFILLTLLIIGRMGRRWTGQWKTRWGELNLGIQL